MHHSGPCPRLLTDGEVGLLDLLVRCLPLHFRRHHIVPNVVVQVIPHPPGDLELRLLVVIRDEPLECGPAVAVPNATVAPAAWVSGFVLADTIGRTR